MHHQVVNPYEKELQLLGFHKEELTTTWWCIYPQHHKWATLKDFEEVSFRYSRTLEEFQVYLFRGSSKGGLKFATQKPEIAFGMLIKALTENNISNFKVFY